MCVDGSSRSKLGSEAKMKQEWISLPAYLFTRNFRANSPKHSCPPSVLPNTETLQASKTKCVKFTLQYTLQTFGHSRFRIK